VLPGAKNVITYDGKTNPSVWLENYRLACRAGEVDDVLFVIQFLPIYLANTSMVWLDHMHRGTINYWEGLKRSSPTTSKALTCGRATPRI
jgi:hypothetical protein